MIKPRRVEAFARVFDLADDGALEPHAADLNVLRLVQPAAVLNGVFEHLMEGDGDGFARLPRDVDYGQGEQLLRSKDGLQRFA
jgi:hypothetical protein